jgi:hypothetical protein
MNAPSQGRMRVERQKLMDKSQAYFWTKEWQEVEKEASEDIKAGRVKAFDTIEELIEDLE